KDVIQNPSNQQCRLGVIISGEPNAERQHHSRRAHIPPLIPPSILSKNSINCESHQPILFNLKNA
ncbi:hypothetical protein S83_022558, partial [Arachis hypogaea]